VRIVRFDASAGRSIDAFGSRNATLSPLMGADDAARTVCIHLAAGGEIAEHAAMAVQLFCVVSGEGWVSGGDGRRHPIGPLQAAHWSSGELHAVGTDGGLVAFVIEGSFEVVASPA
jgi:hypothetical protein